MSKKRERKEEPIYFDYSRIKEGLETSVMIEAMKLLTYCISIAEDNTPSYDYDFNFEVGSFKVWIYANSIEKATDLYKQAEKEINTHYGKYIR